MLTQIRQYLKALDKFWTNEIYRAHKAFEMRRVDSTDIEHWKGFHASLKQAIECWKVRSLVPRIYIPDPIEMHCSGRTTMSRYPNHVMQYAVRFCCLFIHLSALASIWIDRMQGVDFGAIAFSLSLAMGSLCRALKRIRSSASLVHVSYSGLPLLMRVELAFSGDCDQCLSFLRRCTEYGEIVTEFCTFPSSLPTSSHLEDSQDLRERILGFQFETAVVSVKSVIVVQGLSSYQLTL